MKNSLLFLLSLIVNLVTAQNTSHEHLHTRAIQFPDVPMYKSVICDFHIHTVFSDGSVWPDIRVQEAVKDSVDVISLTEHLEYQPHLADIPHPDRNRSHIIAEQQAKAYRLMVVQGAEVTRRMPAGHINAIFIEDANKLNLKDSMAVYREGQQQGGFVFWNHPNWIAQQRDGIATLSDLHRKLIGENLLHGIEVVNDLTYSDEALQIALNNNLTIMGTSDVHGLVDWQYKIDEGGHRPITIVLAKEKTQASIKEALFAGRTIAYFKNLLIGKSENLTPLLEASLTIEKVEYQGPSGVADVHIKNHSNAEFLLDNVSSYTFHAHADIVNIPPNTTKVIQVKTKEQVAEFDLSFMVLNGIIAPNTHPQLNLKVIVNQ